MLSTFFGEPIDLPAWKRDIEIAPGWTMRIMRAALGDQVVITAGGPDRSGRPVFVYWPLGEAHLRAIEKMDHKAACRRAGMIGRLVSKAINRRIGEEC